MLTALVLYVDLVFGEFHIFSAEFLIGSVGLSIVYLSSIMKTKPVMPA